MNSFEKPVQEREKSKDGFEDPRWEKSDAAGGQQWHMEQQLECPAERPRPVPPQEAAKTNSEFILEPKDTGNIETVEKEDDASYRYRTYDELSGEFRSAYQDALRKDVLVGQMYNRLTLNDQYTHEQAIKKIHEDHKDLPGFSPRNIRRNLPKDNPIVPRRKVGPRCPKKEEKQKENGDGGHTKTEQLSPPTLTAFTVTTQTMLELGEHREPMVIPLIVDVDPQARDVSVRVDHNKFNEWNHTEDGKE